MLRECDAFGELSASEMAPPKAFGCTRVRLLHRAHLQRMVGYKFNALQSVTTSIKGNIFIGFVN